MPFCTQRLQQSKKKQYNNHMQHNEFNAEQSLKATTNRTIKNGSERDE